MSIIAPMTKNATLFSHRYYHVNVQQNGMKTIVQSMRLNPNATMALAKIYPVNGVTPISGSFFKPSGYLPFRISRIRSLKSSNKLMIPQRNMPVAKILAKKIASTIAMVRLVNYSVINSSFSSPAVNSSSENYAPANSVLYCVNALDIWLIYASLIFC